MNLTMREHSEPTFGQRLRAAREKKGLARAEIAQRLKLPLRLVARIEDDDYSGMDEGVYLRGYLSSYARLVEIPTVAAESVAAQHTRAAPLVATGKVSRSRYLFDRYSVSATYLILTALIVVPAVWLATHGGLEQNLARTTPLDSPGTSIAVPPSDTAATAADGNTIGTDTPNDAAEAPAADASSTAATTEPPKPQEQMPVVASMAPFGTSTATPPAAPAEAQPAKPAATGAHSLTLKLTAASWVEILSADGSKLEYGLLPAGAEKTYSSDGALSVRLGNADGAEVVVDGKPIDLAPFRHANVARLSLFGADSPKAEF
jgi:cytoskeleton protein RodZ